MPLNTASMRISDAEIMVKRLFRVAEILSREPSQFLKADFCRENDCKNYDAYNAGYCEPEDRFDDA